MEQKAAATWWNENRAALKELATWAAFAERVKARFTPANWKLEALTAFYAVCQNSSDFPAFVTQLENARNALTSAGKGYSIPDSIFKNHLLFHCHPLLRPRVSGKPGFTYENLQVDGLIGNMTTSWLSLVVEHVIRVPTAAPAPTSSLPSVLSPSLPVATSAPAAPAPFVHSITQAEKDTLRAAGGCYHCKKTPQSPGWVKHRSENFPGDSALGIPPRAATSVVTAIGAPGLSSLYDERRVTAVADVMPAPDFEDPNDSSDNNFSAGTDDSY
ncbi:hypothetical protein B0H14DRAFT_3435653 [Mycena olivaceomarginata]|nr:hypothetical protein B0H14DRAFT_3435653 [Mycena olivaceomarginata]